MATQHEVDCIEKADRYDPHERIKFIGGRNSDGSRWKLSEDEAICGIETCKWEFFVMKDYRRVRVIVAVHQGRKYLKTEPDGYSPNNLLSLSSCPI